MRIEEVYQISASQTNIPLGLKHIVKSITGDKKTGFFDESDMKLKDLPSLYSYASSYAVWKGSYDWAGKNDTLWYTDMDGNVQFEVTGTFLKSSNLRPNNIFIISTIKGSKNRTTSAMQFYKHLILHDNIVLISDDQQTTKGSKIWERLNKDSEVDVYLLKPYNAYRNLGKPETIKVKRPSYIDLGLSNTNKIAIVKAPPQVSMHPESVTRMMAIKKGAMVESASAGSTSAGSVASIPNPHVTNPYRKGEKPKQVKPKKVKPTDNALDMNVSLFGGGEIKR